MLERWINSFTKKQDLPRFSPIESEMIEISHHMVVGPPISQDATPIAKPDEVGILAKNRVSIVSGPARIGKTSLLFQLKKHTPGPFLYFEPGAYDSPHTALIKTANNVGIHGNEISSILTQVKKTGGRIAIDELTRVFNGQVDTPKQWQDILTQISDYTIPLAVVIHEFPDIRSQIAETPEWKILAKAPILVPQLLNSQEIQNISLYGNYYIRKKPQKPILYQGASIDTVQEIQRIAGTWPIAASHILNESVNFSRKEAPDRHEITTDTLHKTLQNKWHYFSTDVYYLQNYPEYVLNNVKRLKMELEFAKAFQLGTEGTKLSSVYRDKLFDKSSKPLAIPPSSLHEKLLQSLMYMQTLHETEDGKVAINGLIMEAMLNDYIAKNVNV